MATALGYLQGFNNAVLQALTDDQRSAAIAMAASEVSREAYGDQYAMQLADLAAHDLLLEAAAASSTGSGSGQSSQISEMQDGDVRVKYATSTANSSSGAAAMSDDALARTFYGQRFLRRRAATVIGFTTS